MTINLFLSRYKTLSSFFFLGLSQPSSETHSDHLQCGCSESFAGKPVDYPNCFMTTTYPTIMGLCHWEIAYSQIHIQETHQQTRPALRDNEEIHAARQRTVITCKNLRMGKHKNTHKELLMWHHLQSNKLAEWAARLNKDKQLTAN